MRRILERFDREELFAYSVLVIAALLGLSHLLTGWPSFPDVTDRWKELHR